jgi:hypothetical protein
VGYKQVHETPVPLVEVNSGIPATLAAIVMRCLEKHPDARHQCGADLAAALEEWLHESKAPRGARVRAITPRIGTPVVPAKS